MWRVTIKYNVSDVALKMPFTSSRSSLPFQLFLVLFFFFLPRKGVAFYQTLSASTEMTTCALPFTLLRRRIPLIDFQMLNQIWANPARSCV